MGSGLSSFLTLLPGEQRHPRAACPHPCPLQRDVARWEEEVASLGLSLEAAQRERQAAEWDLEALVQSHGQELRGYRQHLLQVGSGGWGHPSGLPGLCQAALGIPAGAFGPAAPG